MISTIVVTDIINNPPPHSLSTQRSDIYPNLFADHPFHDGGDRVHVTLRHLRDGRLDAEAEDETIGDDLAEAMERNAVGAGDHRDLILRLRREANDDAGLRFPEEERDRIV